ncbi:deoxyribonuclease-1 isoform 2-T8 [Megaptera novaeangliae]
MRGARLMGVLFALAGLLQQALSLRIAAFNIRTFGETKMSNATLSNYIVQILSRYDIALVQEVRDNHLTAVGRLLDKLNQWVTVGSQEAWMGEGMTQTPITMWSVSRWDATAIRSATCSCSEIKEFAIVPLHAAPSDAVAEIDSLYDVYLDVWQKWDLENIMLMGDFNAGCSYVTPSRWSSIRLHKSPHFQWLIPDTADTTVTSTHCAYDRIVVAGPLLQGAVVPNSAAPFDFQAAYGLSDQTALAISDHYPVEVTLKRA